MRVSRPLARIAVLAVLLVALAFPATAHAFVVPMDVDELAQVADAVVVARVVGTSVRAANGDAEHPDIVTDYRLQVSRVLKGSRPASLTITQPGGTLGDIALVVTDVPVYSVGEECALFLDAQGRVVGGRQGAMTVVNDRVPSLGLSVDGLARRVAAADAGFVAGGAAAALAALERAVAPVTGDVWAQAVPVIGSVAPANANGGIGETVTITGSNFGATQGAGRVEFNRGDSMDNAVVVTASVVSWSDTSITVTVPQLAELWVRVVNGAGEASATFAYDCGFSASGRRWALAGMPVTYLINENTADMTGEGAQLQTAFGIWDAAGSRFDLAYGGATSATAYGQDFTSIICFSTTLPAGVLGRNYYWYYLGTPPEIFESDILLNDTYTWAASASQSAWDVQSVALHELGHTVGLDDQYQELGDVMGAGVQGQNKRTLTVDEANGAIYLYGATSTPPAAPTVTSSTHPDQGTWSNATSATFSFTSAGATGYSYAFDGSADTTPDSIAEPAGTSETYSSLAQGTRYFHVRAVNAAGVWSTTTHYQIRVDTVAPTGTAQIGPPGTVYLPSATVAITTALSDGASGLFQMRTTTNGGTSWTTWATYVASTSAIVPGQGTYPVGIQVRDLAGNVYSSLRTLTYDVTAPTTTSDARADYELSASITLTPSDGVSGVADTYYGLDASPTVEYEGDPVTTSALGAHTLYWYSVDNAGNAEGVKSAAFTVSADVPGEVTRLAGPNRYDTAIAIAAATFPGWTDVTDLVVACGEDRAMADPLSAAGLAGAYDAPILLVGSALNKGALPAGVESTIAAIRNANGGRVNIHVIGGTAVVPAAVYSRLDALNGTGTIRRVAGADRYATSVQVANAIVGAVGIGQVPGVLIANGSDTRAFSDALAAAPASAATHRPLLLVRTTGVPADVYTALATTFAGKPRLVVNSATWANEAVRTSVGAPVRIATSADRVTAAVQIAQYACGAGWLDDTRVCVANTLPDALSGGGAMGYLRAPILYTNATSLPSATQAFIAARTSQITEAYALGGTAVISEGVLATLRSLVE